MSKKTRKNKKSYESKMSPEELRRFKAETQQERRNSALNLKDLDKERKTPPKRFKAEHTGGECMRCFQTIYEGQLIHFNDELGGLVHATHKRAEYEYEICERCFLAKPCECDD